MVDLVERLRTPVMLHSNPEQTNAERREAADMIERLREELQNSCRWPDCFRIGHRAASAAK